MVLEEKPFKDFSIFRNVGHIEYQIQKSFASMKALVERLYHVKLKNNGSMFLQKKSFKDFLFLVILAILECRSRFFLFYFESSCYKDHPCEIGELLVRQLYGRSH